MKFAESTRLLLYPETLFIIRAKPSKRIIVRRRGTFYLLLINTCLIMVTTEYKFFARQKSKALSTKANPEKKAVSSTDTWQFQVVS